MKVFLLLFFCALSGYAAGGAIGWPGAVSLSEPVLKTIVPGETKTTAYSTTQYINSLPSSYLFGGQPQFSYHVPQLNSFVPLPAGYYPIGSPSYTPATSVIYPGHPSFVPAYEPASIPGVSIIPGFPSAPSFPGSPAPITPPGLAESPNVQSPPLPGDEDSAVIESAAGVEQENTLLRNQPPTSQQNQPAAPQFPSSNTFPIFPSSSQPQLPEGPTPSFPHQSIPQNSQNIAHNPTNFPQKPYGPPFSQPNFPDGSKPSFPYLTPTSSNPQVSGTPNFPQIPQTSQKPQASGPPPSQSSIPSSPQISQTPQNSFPQFPQIPQNAQGAAPSFPQQPQIPHFPHDLNPSFPQLPQISQNPQGPTHFYPQIGQNPQGSAQVPAQSGQIFSQYPQLTQDFGQNDLSQGPSQTFSPSFPGTNTDSSSLNNEDTISVESA